MRIIKYKSIDNDAFESLLRVLSDSDSNEIVAQYPTGLYIEILRFDRRFAIARWRYANIMGEWTVIELNGDGKQIYSVLNARSIKNKCERS